MTGAYWRIFGSMPSTHDVDMTLEAGRETYRRLLRDLGELITHPGRVEYPPDFPYDADWRSLDPRPEMLTVRAAKIEFLPQDLVGAATLVGFRYGVPLDLFLAPDGDFSLAAWVEPPFDFWQLDWRMTLSRDFFDAEEPFHEEDVV